MNLFKQAVQAYAYASPRVHVMVAGGLAGALVGAIYEGIRLQNAHNDLADTYNKSMEYMISEMERRDIPLSEFDMIALKDYQPKRKRKF